MIGSILSDAKKLLFRGPQGYVLGPILFPCVLFPSAKSFKIIPALDADDTQLYVHLTYKNVAHAFDRLKSCLDDVKKWLSVNKLNLNPDKTDFIILVQNYNEKLNKSFPVDILRNFLSPVVRNLGVWFDSDFFLSEACPEYLQVLFCSY